CETNRRTTSVSHRLGSTNISPEKAVKESIAEVRGAFALAFVFADDPDLLIVARRGSPLVVGTNGASTFAGSDAHALAGLATELTYLEDGDIAVLRRASIKIYDGNGELVERPSRPATAADAYIDKGVHRHFMAKEIFEQPEVIGHTFGRYIDPGSTSLRSLKEVHGENVDLSSIDRLLICACGTAFYAGLTAKYWFESLAGLNVEADIASEVRYRDIPYREGGAALFISQSGETADTMAALAQAKSHGQQIIGVVNVPDSSIARESHINFPTLAGVEVGVASTKAFTCQLATLACLVIHAGRQRNALTAADERKLVTELLSVPRLVAEALQVSSAIDAVAKKLAKARDVLYIGRGVSYPSAMEGALKLKEISYIHAESYAAGELKHGPIALVDENTPVIAVAPSDRHFEKTMSNLQEVVARGARAIVITDNDGKAHAEKIADDVIITPKGTALTAPIVNAVPLQLLAYHTAVAKGTDVDQPRNLAKSVTVE
ncbi:MAG: glutamine--fructose-6-phosphate transaminase (isomerizing), partial [Pseudomonadota bacterium]